jgi:membrane protease YdiL (CAAX protease family)
VSIFSLLFIGLQLIVLPILSFQTREVIEGEEILPPRRALYIQSIIMLSVIGALAALVDWKEDLPVHWYSLITIKNFLLAGFLYITGMLVNFIQYHFNRKNTTDEDGIILPQKKDEYILWIVLCMTAAWSEEYVYRGVLSELFLKQGMVYILAIVLSGVCFSFSHFAQGWIAIPVTFLFALGFQYLYKWSGSLLLPVLVHFVYNISVEYLRRSLIKTTSVDQSKDDHGSGGPADDQ